MSLKAGSRRMIVLMFILIVFMCLIIAMLVLNRQGREYPSPGSHSLSIEVDGQSRHYLIHIPPSYDGKTPLPLVVALHGYGGNSRNMETTTLFSLKADEEGFIVVYPQGISSDSSWNAGFCCGQAALTNMDDVEFIRRIVEKTQNDLKIDSKRIYATGLSNGGMMSHRLGAELSEIFAAIAVVAGSIGKTPEGSLIIEVPSEAVSVIIFHGVQDQVVPYYGGAFSYEYMFSSVDESVSFWVQANHCLNTPWVETSSNGNIIKNTYTGGINGTEVVLYTIMNGAHSWSFSGISTTSLIWEFFENHPKP
ncbi:MAG: PHB depolymerase family esterase [Thermoproteota archaeon]